MGLQERLSCLAHVIGASRYGSRIHPLTGHEESRNGLQTVNGVASSREGLIERHDDDVHVEVLLDLGVLGRQGLSHDRAGEEEVHVLVGLRRQRVVLAERLHFRTLGERVARLLDQLAGERDEVVEVRDADGQVTSTSTRRVPVIAPSHLASLKNHRALLIRRGMPVALARTPIAWRRRDVKRAAAGERAAAVTAVWDEREDHAEQDAELAA